MDVYGGRKPLEVLLNGVCEENLIIVRS